MTKLPQHIHFNKMLVLGSAALIITLSVYGCAAKMKEPKSYTYKTPSQELNNLNFVRDRNLDEIHMPEYPPVIFEKKILPFHPAWMDFCDPYHCNDYHKRACGLNRMKMKFKMFQSTCHILINNRCATYRGALKYDLVEMKFCEVFVMFPRQRGCPSSCPDDVEPVCARSNMDQHLVLFRNQCLLEKRNCDPGALVDEYEEVDSVLCKQSLDTIL